MRSCARRILLAATIFIALVIFCVLLKLAILTRISLMPGMTDGSIRSGGDEFFAALLQAGLDFLGQLRLGGNATHQRLVVGLGETLQPDFERADLLDWHLIHITVVDRVQR